MKGNTYPIILAHGIARFDIFTETILKRLILALLDRSFSQDQLHYFKGIAPFLWNHGFEVHTTHVSFAANLRTRAKDLARELERVLDASGHTKAHIIGHSMGGLDARVMIVDEGMTDCVASVTSIGSPHLGTSFADWGLAHGGYEIVKAVKGIFDATGFEDITLEAMAAFNERARNVEATNDVVYQTYAAAQDVPLVFGPIQPSWHIIFEAEGANDGLVSVQSQRWVSELKSDGGLVKRIRQYDFPVTADHLNQVGWWDVRELRRAPWWRTGIWQEKVRYETAVKHAYLQIVQGLAELEI